MAQANAVSRPTSFHFSSLSRKRDKRFEEQTVIEVRALPTQSHIKTSPRSGKSFSGHRLSFSQPIKEAWLRAIRSERTSEPTDDNQHTEGIQRGVEAALRQEDASARPDRASVQLPVDSSSESTSSFLEELEKLLTQSSPVVIDNDAWDSTASSNFSSPAIDTSLITRTQQPSSDVMPVKTEAPLGRLEKPAKMSIRNRLSRSRSVIVDTPTKETALESGITQDWTPDKAKRSIPSKFTLSRRKHVVPVLAARDEAEIFARHLEHELLRFRLEASYRKVAIVRDTFMATMQERGPLITGRPHCLADMHTLVKRLGQWWEALIDLLFELREQVNAADEEHIVFDAIVAIMDRPEWSTKTAVQLASSQASLDSATCSSDASTLKSEPTEDATFEGIANTFAQHLLKQMTYTILCMSSPHTTSESNNFHAKTCAFAFIHCPGIADILIRLWSPSIGTLQRTLNSSGLTRATNMVGRCPEIVQAFPSHLRSIQFTTLTRLYRDLKVAVPPPVGTAQTPWTGELWMNKWSGCDGDLFYRFCEQYYALISRVIPTSLSAEQSLAVPGLLFVQAQLLSNLDALLARSMAGPVPVTNSASTSDNESLVNSTALRTPPSPSLNSENGLHDDRLLQLLINMTSPGVTFSETSAIGFGQTFSKLLGVAAKSISLSNTASIIALCDLFESVTPILQRVSRFDSASGMIDWRFWIDVFRTMVDCRSNTVELRLSAVLFSLWPSIIEDSVACRSIVNELLLEQTFFEGRFCHACPIVRAYFMRLVCWRLCRPFEHQISTALQAHQPGALTKRLSEQHKTLATVLQRLQSLYNRHMQLIVTSRQSCGSSPSTAPCNPIPGRRLVIIVVDGAPPNTLPATASTEPANRPKGIKIKSNRTVPSGTQPFMPLTVVSPAVPVAPLPSDKERQSGLLWSILNFLQPKGKQAEELPAVKQVNISRPETAGLDASSKSVAGRISPAQPSKHFRFSLEVERKSIGQTNQPMLLRNPELPFIARRMLESTMQQPNQVASSCAMLNRASSPPRIGVDDKAKYAGRALAEWTMVVGECQKFFERRMVDGVASEDSVETPILRLDLVRKPGSS